ncbi:SLAM family member 5-like isoform X3 [Pitangus sulphuratus]|nr:SLAM family member 5-like isoform X3 [Pitangus sulphuratus]
MFGVVGETFTFPVEIKQRIEDIIWKKNKDKVAERDGQKPPTYFPPLEGRSVLKENGNLTIFSLEKSDAGTYELHYWDSGNDGYLTFNLDVLDPPSEPKISHSIKGDNLVLNCTSDFPWPVTYAWKISNDPRSHWSQEFSIPVEDIDATKKATCFITFSQTEKSSEISLIQCISDIKGFLVFLLKRGRAKFERGGVAQKKSPVHGSDRELNKEDSALKDKQTVKNGVNKEELSAMQNSTLTSKCAVDDGVTEEVMGGTMGAECLPCLAFTVSVKDHEHSAVKYGELTQVVEGGNEEHLNNSPSCSLEDRNFGFSTDRSSVLNYQILNHKQTIAFWIKDRREAVKCNGEEAATFSLEALPRAMKLAELHKEPL